MSEKEVDRLAILSLLKERCLTQREAALRLGLGVYAKCVACTKRILLQGHKVSWLSIAPNRMPAS